MILIPHTLDLISTKPLLNPVTYAKLSIVNFSDFIN